MASGDIEKLISQFSRFPGMGSRSALRSVIYLLKKKETVMLSFLNSLQQVYHNSKICEICGNIDNVSPCYICSNKKRDNTIICVVADISDLWSIERAGFYNGLYHVLGNKLSAINGVSPEDLNIDKLVQRLSSQDVREIIIAMSADLDGQTTMFFVNDKLKNFNVKVTALSHGVPMGSELEYLDDGTIIAAFDQRRNVNF